MNHLADRSDAELKALRGRKYTPGFNGGKPFPYESKKEIPNIPDSFDWRIYGAVTPVKGKALFEFSLFGIDFSEKCDEYFMFYESFYFILI